MRIGCRRIAPLVPVFILLGCIATSPAHKSTEPTPISSPRPEVRSSVPEIETPADQASAETVPETSYPQNPDELSSDTASEEAIPEELAEAVYPPVDAGGEEESAEADPDAVPLDEEEPAEITYDIPIELNGSVEDYIEYFQVRIRDKFELWLARSGRYLPLMQEIFKQHGLPGDLVYVALIESGFNPYAYSRQHAAGAWQFIKGTGKKYGLKIDHWVDERRDPLKSTDAAARYLKDLYDLFGSWPLAMAAYNAGEGKIQRALTRAKADDFWDLRSTRYIRKETKGYVPKFMAATIIAKDPKRYGFSLDYHDPMTFDVVEVESSADLRVIAQILGTTYEDLKLLNPELRTEITPPNVKTYTVRLPTGTGSYFESIWPTIPEEKKLIGQTYRIRSGDTLAGIAKKFGASVDLIRQINRMEPGRMLVAGQTLFIPKIKAVPSQTTRAKKSVAQAKRRAPADKKADLQRLQSVSADSALSDSKKIIYKVKEGDTLWDIAQRFNVKVEDLQRYNGLKRRSVIRPGDQIILGFAAAS
jgi:membrane-bound lytic murein transglycosylase D